ncbi:SprT family zinc-dependent metalloprotease [Photorhabdus heterorhabditis]|uniref:SprT family zinc-dependent metalloprotease n=1 Tax=Photorhabdus heterorhabditis TaxID=880156 RepID=UPI0015626F3E|nr:SprT family zinc-dependent metalloprotease [Photorhabdus heterorhabditis]NRN27311.1 SprT family zinc-dependent metalloprotease [Photorhabdus heterorhabditis subsp. aluminescens]
MKSVRVPTTLQQAVMQTLRQKLQQANLHLKRDFPEPIINYRQRGTTAGSAYIQHWEIRLNPVLLIENQQAFIDEVVPHELAHLLVYHYFGKVPPHGKQWRWMMEEVLSVPANRTHKFKIDSVRSKTFTYYCSCQQHALSLRRHNKILRGENHYICRKCGERLIFK